MSAASSLATQSIPSATPKASTASKTPKTSTLSFVNDAKVMAKGQVTIPKNVRQALGIDTGDRITFVVEGGEVKVVNSAIYALQRFQQQMAGKGEAAGLGTDEDIANWITNSRRKEEARQ